MNTSTKQETRRPFDGSRPLSDDNILAGRAESIQRMRQTIDRLRPMDVCVLIQGGSRVRKELAASPHRTA